MPPAHDERFPGASAATIGCLCVRIEPVEDDSKIRAGWSRLAEASGRMFSTPEWIDTWWNHFGEGEKPRLLACLDSDDRLAAVAPMALGRIGPARVIRFAGHGPADALGPVCEADRKGDVFESLAGETKRHGIFLAERIPADTEGLGKGTVELQREPSPTIDISAGWDAYLQSRSSNLRSQVRRKERKLQRENGLAYRLSDAERVDGDMEAMIRLHEARWGSEGAGAFDGPLAAFHRDFARLALERGWLRLWVAEVDSGEPIAVWYGFRFAGEEWYYQSGRDPAWERSSVGLVLLAHTIRAAAGDGVGLYRLLRGGESYKDRFATGDEPVVTVAASRSRLARSGLRLARAASKQPLLRRRMVRLTGA
jgi:CelD/BcsL family acetyltransferase involved in cellulose biosynthesis